MANYANLKSAIQQVVKTNGNNEITGALLQQTLFAIVDSLGADYQFMGVATPSTNPGTPDQNVAYIAGPGTYSNFNNNVIDDGKLGVFKYNGSWVLETVNVGKDYTTDLQEIASRILYRPEATAGANPNAWLFDFYCQQGRTYAIKYISGDRGTIGIGSQTIQILTDDWITFTAQSTGVAFMYISGGRNTKPVIVFADVNGVYSELDAINALIQNNYNTLNDNKLSVADKVNIITQASPNDKWASAKVIVDALLTLNTLSLVWNTSATIAVTQGQMSLSRLNIYDGATIASGTKLKLRVVSTAINKIRIVNNAWRDVLPLTACSNGQIFDVTLTESTTSLGLYLDNQGLPIATGDVQIDLYIADESNPTLRELVDELDERTTELEDSVELLNQFANDGFLYDVNKTISVTQGTAILSRNNILNNVTIPNGNTLKIRLTGTNGVLNRVRLINQNWANVYDSTPYVDGQIITVPLTYDLTMLGLYIETSYAIGTGNVVVSVCTDYDDSISGRIDQISERTDSARVITCKRYGTSGVDADFCGLTAISDAINSITDASPTNRYIIHVMGIFRFTDPLTVPMLAGGEYSIIAKQDYIDLVGDGPDKSMVILDIAPNSTFHSGKTYSDYQPIYFCATGGKVSGIKFVGKNCRYTFHIETGTGAENKQIDVENCVVEYQGHPDYSGGYQGAFGTGLTSGQIWNFHNCTMINRTGAAFAVHTPLHAFDIAPIVTFENCTFDGTVTMHTYQVENNSIINFVDCDFSGRVGELILTYYTGKSVAENADYTRIIVKGNKLRCVYDAGGFWQGQATQLLKGAALRVVSASTGASSIVSFDTTKSAFNAIIGNNQIAGLLTTIYGWNQQYGYVYRDGGVGISGQAFGTIDVSENSDNANAPLGKRLGNCSSTNKVLGIYVDGTLYNVTFNRDYTNVSNDDILAEINTVLGNAAVADIFSPGQLYYPDVNGLRSILCDDENSIFKGMGVVFTQSGMRRAKNSDGYIDGICIEDTANGQYGRVITHGFIYTKGQATADYIHKIFCANDNFTAAGHPVPGTGAGISTTEDGKFDINATPKLLQAYKPGEYTYCWKILEN